MKIPLRRRLQLLGQGPKQSLTSPRTDPLKYLPIHSVSFVLSSFTGNVLALNVKLVGVESWSKANPNFDKALKDVQEVSDENLEKIIELKPDLIIGLSNLKNIDKLKQIAPTVTYTYGKVDYLTQHIEIGKLLNKEKEAKAWVDDFKQRAQKAGTDIKAKIGENKTISVIESFDKQLYVYGDNWGRGTEILYQEMKLTMPPKVKEMALKDGYYALSTEVLPQFMGDYVIFSKIRMPITLSSKQRRTRIQRLRKTVTFMKLTPKFSISMIR